MFTLRFIQLINHLCRWCGVLFVMNKMLFVVLHVCFGFWSETVEEMAAFSKKIKVKYDALCVSWTEGIYNHKLDIKESRN